MRGNNAAERAIRTPVVGRKNYNGSGARWSGELAGHAWTILGTARIAGHNPRAYLSAYLQACAASGGRRWPAGNWKSCCPGTGTAARPGDHRDHTRHPRPVLRPQATQYSARVYRFTV